MVEGAPLLRAYGGKTSIEGSNPSLSARTVILLNKNNSLIRTLALAYLKAYPKFYRLVYWCSLAKLNSK